MKFFILFQLALSSFLVSLLCFSHESFSLVLSSESLGRTLKSFVHGIILVIYKRAAVNSTFFFGEVKFSIEGNFLSFLDLHFRFLDEFSFFMMLLCCFVISSNA